MAPSDSEEEGLEDLEFDGEFDVEDEALDVAADDATEEGDDNSDSEDSEDASEDDDDDDSEPAEEATMDTDNPPAERPSNTNRVSPRSPLPLKEALSPPPTRKRSLSPAQLRKNALLFNVDSAVVPRSYTVEAICALPHPVPTHALASSFCMTHLLTGSDDGYIRDYDIFPAVNGKNFLTAPQRHHSGVVEGIMKSAQIRCWWENPGLPDASRPGGLAMGDEEPSLSPVYSLAMHSDALWALAGTDSGHINLFTVRHEPGRLCHVMNGHRGPVSALSMDHDEKGYFSAGWDGEAIQWDLNTGQRVRNFTAHGAQLAGIAVRPLNSGYSETNSVVTPHTESRMSQSSTQSSLQYISPGIATKTPISNTTSAALLRTPSETISTAESQPPPDSDTKSDASFDPLFDDEPEGDSTLDGPSTTTHGGTLQTSIKDSKLAISGGTQPQPMQPPRGIPPPKNAPSLLDPANYATFSPYLMMTASIDGQIILWDKRVHSTGVGRLWMSEKTPPWCLSACWSADGGQIYAGRRNGTVDIWDVRQLGQSGPSNTPRLLKTLRNPISSGVVSCVVAFPDRRHIACASIDNIRLWNVTEAAELDQSGRTKSGAQFKIIPGHHGGYISQMLVDPGARFLVSASSNRGWYGDSTRTVFVHDIKQA